MRYVQYGCGDCAPPDWLNFDSSLTIRIRSIPVVGRLLRKKLNSAFPLNVIYGDIVKGLPVPDNSCIGVYASHILEHLALKDFRIALKNTLRILQTGGIFRCIVPDLANCAKLYISRFDNGETDASMTFLAYDAVIGIQQKEKGLKGIADAIWGTNHHLWMWDALSLQKELEDAGFRDIRMCQYQDSQDKMFLHVEDQRRFRNAVAFECRK